MATVTDWLANRIGATILVGGRGVAPHVEPRALVMRQEPTLAHLQEHDVRGVASCAGKLQQLLS